jgi:alkanesulfonate monooxygenase SsuD/methylene tetrahydromethanopterin reductase-like flavin-dependent oxidoreductase (luciferase family)
MIPAGSRRRIELVVAGNGPRTIGLAATHADGWATTGPESENVTTDEWWSRVAGLARTFEDAATRAGRDPDTIRRYLNLDSAPVLSVSSLAAFTDAAGRAADLGFTDAVIHWPRPAGVYAGEGEVLDRIAGTLSAGEWTGR